jgi:C1A family cysteine protease
MRYQNNAVAFKSGIWTSSSATILSVLTRQNGHDSRGLRRDLVTRGIAIWARGFVVAAVLLTSGAWAQQPRNDAEREMAVPAEVRNKLQIFRNEIRQKRLSHGVGFTNALQQQRETLLGDAEDSSQTKGWRIEVNKQAELMLKLDERVRVGFLLQNPDKRRTLPDVKTKIDIPCNSNQTSFDWRKYGKVTAVRHQTCGNCWAFAAAAALESSYLIRNGATVDASVQYVNDCGKTDNGQPAGSCHGGLAVNGFQHFKRVGEVNETADPYAGTDKACPNPNPVANIHANTWGFVDPDNEHPTQAQIKDALCKYGPLVTRMRVVSDQIFAYKTGVYNEAVPSDTSGDGHAVLIVGWDNAKNAWLIKNSWDTDWGPEKGFGWIGYDSNRIGRHTAWISAASNFYSIPNISLIKEKILLNQPVPEELFMPQDKKLDR